MPTSLWGPVAGLSASGRIARKTQLVNNTRTSLSLHYSVLSNKMSQDHDDDERGGHGPYQLPLLSQAQALQADNNSWAPADSLLVQHLNSLANTTTPGGTTSTTADQHVIPDTTAAYSRLRQQMASTSQAMLMDDDDLDFNGSDDDGDVGDDVTPTDERSNSVQPHASGSGSGGATTTLATAADGKKKSTRGSRACQVCRKLKMRCVGAEDPPCKRCRNQGHEVRSGFPRVNATLPVGCV